MLPQSRFSLPLQLLDVVDQSGVAVDLVLVLFLDLFMLLLLAVEFLVDQLVYLRDVRRCLVSELLALVQLVAQPRRDLDRSRVQKVNVALVHNLVLPRHQALVHLPLVRSLRRLDIWWLLRRELQQFLLYELELGDSDGLREVL